MSSGIRIAVSPLIVTVLAVSLALSLLTESEGGAGGTTFRRSVASLRTCLSRPAEQVTVLRGSAQGSGRFREVAPRDHHTFDARGWSTKAYGRATVYPFSIGKEAPALDTCVIGGAVIGSQPRSLTWREIKHRYDGDALRLAGRGSFVINGFRASNVEDGISPHGHRASVRIDNAYMRYVRDDCIENDGMVGGRVSDSLFDGCFMGISERGEDSVEQPSGETLTLDGVLLRLQPMPYRIDYDGDRPARGSLVQGRGHGQLFKWSNDAHRLVLKDSIFLVHRLSVNGARPMNFPLRTVAKNVTLIWLGEGDYPGRLPKTGVTVVKDRSLWEAAKNRWLRRHGCMSFNRCDPSKLINPSPLPATGLE